MVVQPYEEVGRRDRPLLIFRDGDIRRRAYARTAVKTAPFLGESVFTITFDSMGAPPPHHGDITFDILT